MPFLTWHIVCWQDRLTGKCSPLKISMNGVARCFRRCHLDAETASSLLTGEAEAWSEGSDFWRRDRIDSREVAEATWSTTQQTSTSTSPSGLSPSSPSSRPKTLKCSPAVANSLFPETLLIQLDWALTPSLPWCHLKTIHKSAQFETLKLFSFLFFCLFFLHLHVKGFSSKRTALKVGVAGPENVLFGGASVHLLARKFYRLGQWRG